MKISLQILKSRFVNRLTGVLFLVLLFHGCTQKNEISKETVPFYGDSHVAKWNLPYFFPDVKSDNKGVDGATIDNVIRLIDQDNSTGKYAVVLIGTNDFLNILAGGETTAAFQHSMDSLMLLLSKRFDRSLVINLLPLGKQYGTNPSYDALFLRLSNQIDSLALSHNVIRVYSVSAMLSKNNILSETYTQDDIHLNSYGYEVLSNETRTEIFDFFK
jgi:lysophospholipase L1-like esterase